ncbi:MAG: cyclic nucleotide-binding domain-containing protein [Magnetococcales bacterium]|nr:cyclic nucleotide-binding domain-containing protein [Magnetococcales bacterium]
MLVQCEACAAKFEVDDNRLLLTKADASGKRKLRCAFCKVIFFVDPPQVVGDPLGDAGEEAQNPDLMGTMVLNLTNKPKASLAPPPRKKPELSTDGLMAVAAGRLTSPGAVPSPPTPSPKGGVPSVPPIPNAPAGAAPPAGELKRVMAPPARKVELLGKSGWLPGADWEEIKIMAPYWELYRAGERTTLFRPGDKGSFAALVIKGELRLSDPVAVAPASPLLATLGAGECCGEITLLDGKPHAALAVTTQESFLLILTKARFDEMFKDHHRPWKTLQGRMLQGICRRFRELSGAGAEWLSVAAPPPRAPGRG